MIFFLIDYLKYRNRNGPYSDASLEKEGWKKGPYFIGRESVFRPSHIVVVHTRGSFISWLVMYYSSSRASHVCQCLADSVVADFTTGGLVEHKVSDYFDENHFLALRSTDPGPADKDWQTVFLKSYYEISRPRELKSYFSWLLVITMWYTNITAGRNRRFFRWRFCADYLILFMVLSFGSYVLENALSCMHLISDLFLGIFAAYSILLVKNKVWYVIMDRKRPTTAKAKSWKGDA